MRDYGFVPDDGRPPVPVAEMTTADIEDCLRDGVKSISTESAQAIIERLQLELFIRERNLRSE